MSNKDELNSIACEYCGGHGLDMRGNCAGCGAPTNYVELRNRQHGGIVVAPGTMQLACGSASSDNWWTDVSMGAQNAWNAVIYR